MHTPKMKHLSPEKSEAYLPVPAIERRNKHLRHLDSLIFTVE